MDHQTNNRPFYWLTRGRAAAIAAVVVLSGGVAIAAGAQNPEPITAAESEQAEQNLALFDRLDFEAWNNRDWDLFRQLHAPNVKVAGGGQETETVEDHLAWAQAVVAQVPDSRVVAHPIRIGAGDWTAVTGLLSDGSTAATIARWENGQIVEEYLFLLVTGQ